jgi:hypothetical protein
MSHQFSKMALSIAQASNREEKTVKKQPLCRSEPSILQIVADPEHHLPG